MTSVLAGDAENLSNLMVTEIPLSLFLYVGRMRQLQLLSRGELTTFAAGFALSY